MSNLCWILDIQNHTHPNFIYIYTQTTPIPTSKIHVYLHPNHSHTHIPIHIHLHILIYTDTLTFYHIHTHTKLLINSRTCQSMPCIDLSISWFSVSLLASIKTLKRNTHFTCLPIKCCNFTQSSNIVY